MRERFAACTNASRRSRIARRCADLAAIGRDDLSDVTRSTPDGYCARNGARLVTPFAPARNEIEFRAGVLPYLLTCPPPAPRMRATAWATRIRRLSARAVSSYERLEEWEPGLLVLRGGGSLVNVSPLCGIGWFPNDDY
jgi:hypothetical protein